MKVGFIGVGTMGRHMAANLQKSGFSLVINDVKKDAAASHLKNGAAWAETPKAVAEASDVVFTSLPGPIEVEAVALGANGLLAGMSAGKVYLDLSTNSPTVMRRIHAIFEERTMSLSILPHQDGFATWADRRVVLTGAVSATSIRLTCESLDPRVNKVEIHASALDKATLVTRVLTVSSISPLHEPDEKAGFLT